MSGKIFISYRREDTAGIAHGICQYLQNKFGSRSVFIDVDMQAGAKFPELLERRLSECKVLLVLIGQRWLDVQDKAGNRRLDQPSDWVRLEIARALKRGITVVPVRVEGADLPERSDLPGEIQGLVDHQAVTVTTAGFRNEMAGLARDIRAISNRSPKLMLIVAAVLALIGVAGISVYFISQRPERHVADPSLTCHTPAGQCKGDAAIFTHDDSSVYCICTFNGKQYRGKEL